MPLVVTRVDDGAEMRAPEPPRKVSSDSRQRELMLHRDSEPLLVLASAQGNPLTSASVMNDPDSDPTGGTDEVDDFVKRLEQSLPAIPGPGEDIPHVSAPVIVKYVTNLQPLGLL